MRIFVIVIYYHNTFKFKSKMFSSLPQVRLSHRIPSDIFATRKDEQTGLIDASIGSKQVYKLKLMAYNL